METINDLLHQDRRTASLSTPMPVKRGNINLVRQNGSISALKKNGYCMCFLAVPPEQGCIECLAVATIDTVLGLNEAQMLLEGRLLVGHGRLYQFTHRDDLPANASLCDDLAMPTARLL